MEMWPRGIRTEAGYAVCKKCGKQWISRVVNPKLCPFCKSQYWNKQKHPSEKQLVRMQLKKEK